MPIKPKTLACRLVDELARVTDCRPMQYRMLSAIAAALKSTDELARAAATHAEPAGWLYIRTATAPCSPMPGGS